MCVYTSAGRPIHQLQPSGAEAAIGTDAVGALASQTQAVVLTFIHICIDAHTHTHTHRHHQHDTFTPAANHRVSLQICHLGEELPDHSEHVRKVMHHLHQQVMTTYCAGTDDGENDTDIINSSDHSEPPTVLYLHMRARWVPLRSPGHRPCRRRSPLCWCTHPWGTHLVSGTRQCLRGRRRRKA